MRTRCLRWSLGASPRRWRSRAARSVSSTAASFVLRASHGLSAEFLLKGGVAVASASATEEALAGRAVVAHIEDVRAWQYPEESSREGIATSLTMPLVVLGRPSGILRLYAADRRDFSADEIEFVAALAELSALAIRNASLHRRLQRERDLLAEYSFGLPAATR